MKRVAGGDATRAVVRRRRFTQEFKRQAVKEALAAGASVSSVALKHRLNTNMLFTWRRRYLHELADAQSVNLLPVRIEASESALPMSSPEPSPTEQSLPQSVSTGCIEIEVFGACIRINGALDTQTLRSVLDALSGR